MYSSTDGTDGTGGTGGSGGSGGGGLPPLDDRDPDGDAERARVRELTDDTSGWRRWGPYLSDRAWGTVREDYSADGDAWAALTYDAARAKAYRWGDDGIAGISDRYQVLCFAPAFWNERDGHLKERLFGVTPREGNHGEDVKEYYVHVDNVPSHAYMAMLYRYPQAAFPYRRLVEENQRRNGQGPEFELLHTGVFDDNRYFDLLIEYGKASPEDLVIRITATNRGPDAAPLHILPTLWFRNTWSWGPGHRETPVISEAGAGYDERKACGVIGLRAEDNPDAHDLPLPPGYLGPRWLYGPADCGDVSADALFTNNETNGLRAYGPGNLSRSPWTKDAFHRYLCEDEPTAICPDRRGTKAALHYRHVVPAGGTVTLRLRLTPAALADPLADVDELLDRRKREADRFYERLAPAGTSADERLVQRSALAGLLWSKQSYLFDVARWLDGDNPSAPPPASRKDGRNARWRHLNSMRVMSVPDKWEYPWFAAWDLAFQCVAFAMVDGRFAKDQLWLLLFEQFQHPSGQIPAYEWEFSDLNPPVHAWAVWRVYNMDRIRSGTADRVWLERCFHKLLINFASWVNKVDYDGNNVFEGGFLGLDNITVVDRSESSHDGSVLEQSDATGWMGMFCLNLMRIALELARDNHAYEGLATKFLQHYVYVAHAMKHMGGRDHALFDEDDGFFYDVLRYPDGSIQRFRVRSLVGLIPLFAVERLESAWIAPFREFNANLNWFLENRRDLVADVIHTVNGPDGTPTYLLTVVNASQLEHLLGHLHDEDEFLSPYGVRSLSKAHEAHPFELNGRRVAYEPAESSEKLKGGNSNWRGPIWFPTTFLLIESLRKLGTALGPDRLVHTPAAPAGIPFKGLARDLARRLIKIFLLDEHGRRPVFGGEPRFVDDPTWRDHLLFYEHFHGDNGAGLGASHQTGWTALVANLIDEWP
ncbi:MAG TPA: glucosidase [Kofleriaceae bacterium]|nr:glucosidase [Kofleriaceae bacterium]